MRARGGVSGASAMAKREGADAMMFEFKREGRADGRDAPAPNDAETSGEDDAREVVYEQYAPTHGGVEGGPHPDPVVETGTLAKVRPPEPRYAHAIGDVCAKGGLSALQMESVLYACMRYEQRLPGARGERAGFFLGDGAGVGKGRQIAGLVYEHRRRGGRRVLWVSTSADLKYDADRDLKDLKVEPEIDVVPRGTSGVPRNALEDTIDAGVVFSTYALLQQGSPSVTNATTKNDEGLLAMISTGSRLEQFVNWLKEDAYGPLIIFDECHKAKNLYTTNGKPTKTAVAVVALQYAIPDARVLYCSATGASEPRNLAYMTRLGHFGWRDMQDMLTKLDQAGLGALEMFACGLKATGSYLCRTLSYEKAEFELVNCPLSDDLKLMYDRSTQFWTMMKKIFTACAKLRGHGSKKWCDDNSKSMAALNRLFWATHQRFFRQMLLCCKVPRLAELARKAVLHEDLAVVIGLQSTGEASLARVSSDDEEGLDDFMSSPAEMLSNFLKSNFPTNSCRASAEGRRLWDTVLADIVRVVNTWCSQETILEVLGRDAARVNARAVADNANGDGASSDSDIELAAEKSLDEVLAERLEAAKRVGNFLDLTDEDIEIRAYRGVGEAQVAELERMEEVNRANEEKRRQTRLDEERRLAERNRQRVDVAVARIVSDESVPQIAPRARDCIIDNEQPARRNSPSNSGSKRESPSSQVPDSSNTRRKVEDRPEVLDLTLSDDSDDDDDDSDVNNDYARSVQKRREEYERNRMIIDGENGVPAPAGQAGNAAAAGNASGIPVPARPVAARDPPKPVVNAVDALERLRRFAPAVRAAPLGVKAEGVPRAVAPRAPRAAVPRHVARAQFYDDSSENGEADNNMSSGDDGNDDVDDNPDDDVENPHLVHIKELMLRAVDALQLPPNPLDNLITLCGGPAHVAEMTGRKLHQVRDEDGKVRTKKRRDDDITNAKLLNITEKMKFQNGEKLIAIISDAASTGISLQADKRVENQRRRCHMTLELPWSADKAIQQFGRSHRSNQSSAPLYRILMTPCGGERRFASSAAKRLLSLGALLKGDRNALGAGEGLQAFDIDNQYGSKAMKRVITDILDRSDPMPTVKFEGAELAAAINIIKEEFRNVGIADYDDYGNFTMAKQYDTKLKTSLFLNRLLGMPVNAQKVVFDYFTQTFEGIVKEYKQNGTYDRGVIDITGQSVVAKVEHNRVIHKCEMSGAETRVRLVQNDDGVSFRHACALKREFDDTRANVFAGSRQRGIAGFYIATNRTAAKTNRPFVMFAKEVRNFGEETLFSIRNPQMLLTRPNKLNVSKMSLEHIKSNYTLIEPTDVLGMLRVRELWHFWYEFFSKHCVHGKGCPQRRVHGCNDGMRHENTLLICGAVLPVWSTLNTKFKSVIENGHGVKVEKHLQVCRAETTLGEKFVGLKLTNHVNESDYHDYVGSLEMDIANRLDAGIEPEGRDDADARYAGYSSDEYY